MYTPNAAKKVPFHSFRYNRAFVRSNVVVTQDKKGDLSKADSRGLRDDFFLHFTFAAVARDTRILTWRILAIMLRNDCFKHWRELARICNPASREDHLGDERKVRNVKALEDATINTNRI
ncbi:hypothetical protein PENANT_c039G10042 [Penicillium antarcticum]|uniref:Uncharacterized protein n=1 Tax=Penicillium antarcticum TaxID=416450 RepID=A0A1V6PSV4_9EURO|nr:hypothetical protein PENANT_c039G10042 [Penicillium antarcticum]